MLFEMIKYNASNEELFELSVISILTVTKEK